MPIYALGDTQPVFADRARAWIAPDATVIGQVRIGLDVSIWFGAVLRGDNDLIEVGDGANIQEHTMVHVDAGVPVRIGANVTVGHRAIVHGATIGEGSLSGMGATLLDHVVVGRDCLVGANALLTQGKQFPDGHLIMGAPAKAVRPLGPDEIALLRRGAAGYVDTHRRFAATLRRID